MTTNSKPASESGTIIAKIWKQVPNWAAVATLIGLFLPLILNALFAQKRKLTLQFLTSTPIVSIDTKTLDGLQLTYRGALVENATLVQVRLSNTGNMPILESEIESPLTMLLSSGTLLSAAVTSSSPENLKAKLTAGVNEAVLKLGLLNPNDHVDLTLVISNTNALPHPAMRVAGVKSLEVISTFGDETKKQPLTWPAAPRWVEISAALGMLLTASALSLMLFIALKFGDHKNVFRSRTTIESSIRHTLGEEFWSSVTFHLDAKSVPLNVEHLQKILASTADGAATYILELSKKFPQRVVTASSSPPQVRFEPLTVEAARTLAERIRKDFPKVARRLRSDSIESLPRVFRTKFKGIASEAALMANRPDQFTEAVISELTELAEGYHTRHRIADGTLGPIAGYSALALMILSQCTIGVRLVIRLLS